jgi:hypothetical protein
MQPLCGLTDIGLPIGLSCRHTAAQVPGLAQGISHGILQAQALPTLPGAAKGLLA